MSAIKLFGTIIMGGILLSAGGSIAGGNPEVESMAIEGGSMAADVKGDAQIVLDGGSMGFVTFPHGRHQEMFADCQLCHELFPQEPQVIDRMMVAGKLKRKVVMNMCKDCHKDLAEKGQKAGPTVCKGCHKK